MADEVSKKSTQELIDLHKQLSDILRTTIDLRNKELPIVKELESIQRKITKATKDQSKSETAFDQLQRKIQERTSEIAKMNESMAKFGTDYNKEIAELLHKQNLDSKKLLAMEKQINHEHGLGILIQQAGLGKVFNILKTIGTLAKTHPILAVGSALISVFTEIFLVFKGIDDAAAKFRREMGTTRAYSNDTRDAAIEISSELLKVGVTAGLVLDSFFAIGKSVGTTLAATDSMARDMALMSAQLGITVDRSAAFLKTMAMAGKSTLDAQKNMLFFTAKMAQAARIPLDDVMADVAQASQEGYTFMSRNPLVLAKASIEAKRLGTSLASATTSAKTLVAFTSSVKDEMEASVLLGKNLNLQHARELAYRRDLKGLNDEILKIAKATHFEDLDPFQQEAVAKALGKSAAELGNILQVSRERQRIESAINADPNLKKQREELDAMLRANRAIAESVGERARMELTSEGNQSRLTSISNSWKKIMQELGRVFLPIIDTVLGFIANHMDGIFEMSSALFALWKIGSRIFPAVASVFSQIVAFLKPLTGMFKFLGLLRFASPFVKWIPIIGWVITAISFVINLFKRLKDIGSVFKEKGFWAGIVYGLEGIVGAIYDTLLKPFVDIWNYLKKTFFGSSPSQLGMLIVRGLEAVQSMLVGLLISPFQTAWNIIKEIPFVGKLFGKSITANVEPVNNPTLNVEGPTGAAAGFKPIQGVEGVNGTSLKGLMDGISLLHDDIQSLRKDFKDGSITATVNLDGQKVDQALGRNKLFKGDLSPV